MVRVRDLITQTSGVILREASQDTSNLRSMPANKAQESTVKCPSSTEVATLSCLH